MLWKLITFKIADLGVARRLDELEQISNDT